MSAITDALRRASSAAKTTPAAGAQTPPPLPPMPVPLSPPAQSGYPAASPQDLPPVIGAELPYSEFTAQPQRRSALPFVFALLVVLLVFGVGASFLYARKNGPALGKMNGLAKFESYSADQQEEEEPEIEVLPAARPASSTTAAATTTPAPAPAPASTAATVPQTVAT